MLVPFAFAANARYVFRVLVSEVVLNVAEVDSVTRGDVVRHDGAVRLEQAPSVDEMLRDESFTKTIIEVPAVAHFDEVGGVA